MSFDSYAERICGFNASWSIKEETANDAYPDNTFEKTARLQRTDSPTGHIDPQIRSLSTLEYSWSLTNATGKEALECNGPEIIHRQIKPSSKGSVVLQVIQQVGVEVRTKKDPIGIAKNSVGITFRPATFVAVLSGGDRAVSSNESFNLSADASSDRDNPNLQVSFQWSCKNNIGTKCRRPAASMVPCLSLSPLVSLSSLPMCSPTATYMFSKSQ